MGGLQARINGRPRLLYPGVNTIVAKVALADVNTGKVIFANPGVWRFRVTDVRIVAREAAATGLTLFRVITDETTPVVIATGAQANMTEDNHLKLGVTGFANGAGFGVDLEPGAGFKVDKTGSALAGSDYIEVEISFQITDPGPGMGPRESDELAVI